MPAKANPKKTKKPEKPVKGKGGTWPVNSKRITQTMTGGHKGVDVGIPIGTRLVAPEGGTVVVAGTSNSGYGKYVKIRTKDGKEIILGHLSEIDVRAGQAIREGQLVGLSGNTGNSTGPHVHIEIRKGGGFLDPLDLYTGNYQVTGGGSITPIKPTAKAGKAGTKPQAGEPEDENGGNPVLSYILPGMLPDLQVNWGNVLAVVGGVILITVGVTGIVIGEGAKLALQPITDPLKEALSPGEG